METLAKVCQGKHYYQVFYPLMKTQTNTVFKYWKKDIYKEIKEY